jgi:predicted transcriptional regulator
MFQEKKELTSFIDKEVIIELNKPEKPEKLNMSGVQFIVITKDNVDSIKELLNSGISLIAITSKGYENLSLNMADLKRYIKQQKEIILYYEKTIDNGSVNNESVDKSD